MTNKTKVIVKFKNGGEIKSNMQVAALEEFADAYNGKLIRTYNSINAVSMEVPVNKIGKLQTCKDVEYVEIDGEVHLLGFPSVVTPKVEQVPWGISKIRATEVHNQGNKGTGIKVCIVDTGIDYNHEDLKTNYKGGYNYVANTPDPLDNHGHGTHVAGTIAAIGNNDLGVIGVAPEAHIYACKVLDQNGSGSYSNVIAGIQYAIDNNLQIISMSLGGSSSSQALKDACDAAYNAGIVVVAAAGNSGGDGSQDNVGYPAKYDSVIAVAATDINDVRASFSSTGPTVELSAPGVNVLSSVPKSGTKISDPSGYKALNGTSMATPHVSGTMALLLKAKPDITSVQAREILQQATIDLGGQGRDVFFGFGRIDAMAAVSGETPPPPPPTKKYKCSGTPDYQCTEDPNGTYNSIEECQNACKETPPTKKYKCSGTPDYQCTEDPNGPYNSLTECQAACKPAPQIKKFKIQTVGLPTKPSGILVMKSTRGDYTADEACKVACNMLKNMDA